MRHDNDLISGKIEMPQNENMMLRLHKMYYDEDGTIKEILTIMNETKTTKPICNP